MYIYNGYLITGFEPIKLSRGKNDKISLFISKKNNNLKSAKLCYVCRSAEKYKNGQVTIKYS